jgi:hypothetical protein
VFLCTYHTVSGTFTCQVKNKIVVILRSRRRKTQLTTIIVRTKEQGVANALAGLLTSRFTAVNNKDQLTTAMSNGVYGNWRRGPLSANSYHSYTGLKVSRKNDHSYLLVRAHA